MLNIRSLNNKMVQLIQQMDQRDQRVIGIIMECSQKVNSGEKYLSKNHKISLEITQTFQRTTSKSMPHQF